ncbi:MAG: 30S ribosomal protein S12 methylthiotransferase RimO [Clostridia bacterium]|nr:30S ribosomal protein S12 methylthiotransferase RimO [Clostridia bacterium]
MGVKIGFVSLGCAKNLVDTEIMLHHVAEAGYEVTADETEADVVIINTCGFIESAKKEAIDNILDVAWLKKNRSLKALIVTGCLAERYREEVAKEMPEVDAVLGTGSIHSIVDAVEAVLRGEKFIEFKDQESIDFGGDRVVTTGDAFAYLKISEGCRNRCTYCAIPRIRGNFRSRTIESLVAEAKDLEKLGIKELDLIGQDTTCYGIDVYGKYMLPELIRRICRETSIPWIRVLYCYPDKITDEFIEEMRTNPRLLHYVDMPIQHISDSVLKAMNRHGDSACIKDAIARIRAAVPDAVIRTTAIVGFPGEREEDFEELCRFVLDAKFERFGAFPYSREEDTPAYDFEDQIGEQVKQDRYDILMRHQLTVSEEFGKSNVGKTLTVLCESYDDVSEAYVGRSYMDAPDVDGKVFFTSPAGTKFTPGEFVEVKITESMDYDLVGETAF